MRPLLYFAYSGATPLVFHRFRVLGVNIGTWMAGALLMEGCLAVSQIKIFWLCVDYVVQDGEMVSHTPISFFHLVALVVHISTVATGFWGLCQGRGWLCAPFCAATFGGIVATIIVCMMLFVPYLFQDFRSYFWGDAVFLLLSLPFRFLDLVIAVTFLLFMREMEESLCYRHDEIEQEIFFQMQRRRYKTQPPTEYSAIREELRSLLRIEKVSRRK